MLSEVWDRVVFDQAILVKQGKELTCLKHAKTLAETDDWVLIGISSDNADEVIGTLVGYQIEFKPAMRGCYDDRYEVLAEGGPVSRQYRAPIQKESARRYIHEIPGLTAAYQPGQPPKIVDKCWTDLDDVRLDHTSFDHPDFERHHVFYGITRDGRRFPYKVAVAAADKVLKDYARDAETVEDFALAIRQALG